MTRFPRMLAVVLLALLALFGAASPAAADVNDFSFDELTVDYTLTRDDDGASRLLVVERFVARFPDTDQNRGIRRSLPDSYNGQPLHPRLLSVTDENGAVRPAETDDDDGVFTITSRADDYLRGVQTFVLTYELENVTWAFADTGQEFYWDVNGVDWEQPFGQVTARLHLDGDLAAAATISQAACYRGDQGSSQACDALDEARDGDSVVITARAADVGPHQTLTLAVGFEPETFVLFDPSYTASPAGWTQAIAGVAMLGGVGLAVRARRRALRDEPGRPTIIAEYAPPPGVDALESAVLLGQQSKAIPAEVLEQAVVGSIRIVEGSSKAWGGKRLVAELVDPSRADRDGRMLLDGLFPSGVPGEKFEFGRDDTRFSKVAQKILAAADRDLSARGFRREVPAGTRSWPVLAAVVPAFVVFISGAVALVNFVSPAVPITAMVLAGLVLAVVIGLVARRPLTAAGAETRDHLQGLKQFIEWAEADRIRMLQSPGGAERVGVDVGDPRQKLHLYERLLPYAVVFGQEKEWSAELAVLYTAAGMSGPYWYAGAGAFDASSFSSGIGSLSAAATSSSSTSGGSSGGGSAGGGGGGGGGGGV